MPREGVPAASTPFDPKGKDSLADVEVRPVCSGLSWPSADECSRLTQEWTNELDLSHQGIGDDMMLVLARSLAELPNLEVGHLGPFFAKTGLTSLPLSLTIVMLAYLAGRQRGEQPAYGHIPALPSQSLVPCQNPATPGHLRQYGKPSTLPASLPCMNATFI